MTHRFVLDEAQDMGFDHTLWRREGLIAAAR